MHSNWNPKHMYRNADTVWHGDVEYIALGEGSTGVEPGSDPTKWLLLDTKLLEPELDPDQDPDFDPKG